MGELPLETEESLRIAAPKVYERMIETFSKHKIHPFDAEGVVIKKEEGFDFSIKLAGSRSNIATKQISYEQSEQPDDEVISFFEMTAEECKSRLIKDYYRMMKP